MRFVLYCRANRMKSPRADTVISTGNGFLDADIYFPRFSYQRGRERGTILLIHGMTAKGNADPRIVTVCEAFARCGYVVVSPLFRDISNFSISDATIRDIAEAARAVASNRLLCRNGKILLFAPSFSAGMALLASTHPLCAPIIESICSVGTYGSVHTVINDLMTREDRDEYGRLIIMKNFIHHAPGFNRRTGDILHEAILDNGLKRAEKKFFEKLSRVPESLRRRIERLLNDARFRSRVWEAILARSSRVRTLMKRLSVLDNMSPTTARIVLVHGKHDNVIPPEESRLLYSKLQDLGVPSALCITPLISHGDARLERGFFRNCLQLIHAFAFFFG